jgi:hypothetical protein
MRRLRIARPASNLARVAPILGLIAGGVLGAVAIALAGSALAQRPDQRAQGVLEATHLPPLLTLPGERIDLAYDAHCATAGVEDPEQGCTVGGSVFLRSSARGVFRALPLTRGAPNGLPRLSAVVPDAIAGNQDGFEYYAELTAADGRTLTVPSGGAEAPHRVHVLTDAVHVDLGAHAFGSQRPASARVASAQWGDGPTDVGLEQGRSLGPIGASAFDVDAMGNIVLLDHAHRRMLQWQRGTTTPARVPLSIEGRLADMSIAGDGSIYVLETTARPGRTPLIRRFDADGRELDVVEAAERTPSQLRVGPAGPVVLQQPSNQWMPVATGGSPVGPSEQRRRARSGRPLRGGGEVLVLRRDNEIRVALVVNGDVRRSWRVSSGTSLAEVQLAEPYGQRLVLVVRAYADGVDEFAVLVLGPRGLEQRFSIASADWAETAPLGRFRLVGGSLYRLGSSPTGAFVDRFDLEVR